MTFFYRSANMQNKINKIHTLRMDEGSIQGLMIKEHIYHHFKWLFGGNNPFRIRMKDGAWTPTANLGDLEEEFREEEIKKAIWELGPDKGPGLDSFPLFFFRIF